MKQYGRPIIGLLVVLLALIPDVYGAMSVEGGILTSSSGGSSIQGIFAADNNGATFLASSTGLGNGIEKNHLLDFGKYKIESSIALEEGSIDACSETTKTTGLGSETSVNLKAEGSSVYAALSGKRDSSAAGQMAGVLNGAVSSDLMLVVDDSILAYQNTNAEGDEGILGSIANSKANKMAIDGSFLGSGDFSTEQLSVAGSAAKVYGTVSFNGQEVINGDVLDGIASGELAVSSDGIYEDRNGDLGAFEVSATNLLDSSANSIGYETAGWMWASPIHYKLSTSVIGRTKATSYAKEISKGANEWDSNTAKNVFKGTDTANTPGSGNVLELTAKTPVKGRYQGGTGDGNNNYMAFSRAVTGSTIAVTYTWYYTNVYVTGADGNSYNKAAESDVYFSANKAWRIASRESSATNSKFDVRTIATHEVGHSLGLADLYGSTDSDKIMYGYNNGQVKWSLRSGDKLGLWTLYGA